MNNNITAWNNYISEYNSKSEFSDDLIHIGLALPGISACDIVKSSKSVLDIGCGNGINTYLMSQAPDVIVTGIDPVKEQIDYAIASFYRKNLSFFCVDFYGIPINKQTYFDLVTFFGSLDYIQLNERFFGKLNMLTHTESRCYISKFHPMWTTLFFNDTEDVICNNSYFDAGRIDLVKFGKSQFQRYHYGIGEMITLFNNANWKILAISEPRPDFKNSAFAYEGYQDDPVLGTRLKRIPMTILFEFIRS